MAFITAENAKKQLERLRHGVAKVRDQAEKAMGVGIAAVEVAGTSAAMGYLNERYGTPDKDGDNVYTIASVDVDLATGVTLHAASFFGAIGKYSEHGHNIGNGGVGAYAYRQGAKYGRQAKKDAAAAPTKGLYEGDRAHVSSWGRAYTPQHAHARY